MIRRVRERDSGTISILAVGAIVAVITSATLAVDLGRVAWSSRDQQGATDRAALDALRAITDLWDVQTENWSFGTYDAQARAEDLAASSLAANTGAEGRATDTRVTEVHLGRWDQAANTFCVWHGSISSSPGNCHDEFPTAVFVQTTSNIDTLFVGSAMTEGSNQVIKEAIAEVEHISELKVGSSLATIDSDDAALLNPILGDLADVSLGVVAYNGLLNADVGVQALLTQLGISVGSPSAVLDSTTVSMASLFTATASALTNQGDAASLTAATIFTQLAADVDASQQVTIGDMLNVTTGHVGSIGDVSLNAFDLVRGTIVAGDGSNFASISGFEALVPGVASAALDLTIVEPEQFAIGPARWNPATGDWFTKATTSQLDADMDFTLQPVSYLTYNPLVIDVPLHILGGQAEAAATSAWCLDNGSIRGGTTETATDAATAWIGGPNAGDWATVTTLSATVPLLGTINIAQVRLRSITAVAGSTFDGHHEPLPETVSGGGTALNIPVMLDPGNYEVQVVLLGVDPLGLLNSVDLANRVVNAIVGRLGDIDTNVVNRLTRLTGLHVGAADTTLIDVHCEGGRILRK